MQVIGSSFSAECEKYEKEKAEERRIKEAAKEAAERVRGASVARPLTHIFDHIVDHTVDHDLAPWRRDLAFWWQCDLALGV